MNTLFLDLIFIVSFRLCVFVPCIIWQLYMTKFKNVRYGRMHYVMTYIFIFYLSMALEVTGIPTIYELIRSGIVIDSGTINLVPFSTDTYTISYILNIIMFMPLGFLLPMIWRKCRFHQVLLIGMLSSLAIEIMQLFNWRVSDIDDLLMNTLGAVIGFFLFKFVDMIIHGIYSIFAHNKNSKVESASQRHARATAKSKTPNISEAIAYIILSYLGVFFLYNFTGISALVERFE